MTTKTYKSEVAAAIHGMISDCYEAGVIDKQTMQSFDESCLVPIHEFTPEEIQALREREEVNQAVFGYYLSVSENMVSQWESGEEHPVGPSLKLLSLVEKKGLAAIV
ncbi:MAG TPA: DNA-binding transcriptional regulator [Ktedonobacteraceae bacterium]|nr:DNA-binding transcriptional regulator [Ktedonobacteraceae bacterium]